MRIKTLLAAIALSLAASPGNAAEKFVFNLNFLAYPIHSGFFLAKKNGYYADAGIDLEVIEGKGSSTTAQLIASGQADAGMMGAEAAMNVIGKGAPMKVIAEHIQINSQGIISYVDSGISSSKDLVGKTITTCAGCLPQPMLRALLLRDGIDPANVTVTNTNSTAWMGLLAERQVDAVATDPGTLGIEARLRGLDVKELFFSDLGINMVGYVIAARTDKLEAKPDLYKKFVEASLRGYSEAAKNPDAAIDALLEQYPNITTDRATLKAGLVGGILPFLCTGGAEGMGKAPDAIWQDSYAFMVEGMGMSSDRPLAEYYTRDFLPAQLPACN